MIMSCHRTARAFRSQPGALIPAWVGALIPCMLIALACGGRTDGGRGSVGDSAGGGSIRTTGDRAQPLPPPRCPATAPMENSPCTIQGLSCSWGDSTEWRNRSWFECISGRWNQFSPGRGESQPAMCPATTPNGATCPEAVEFSIVCSYPEGVLCVCYPCDGRSPGIACDDEGRSPWTCSGPPTDLDCPLLAPNLGDGCNFPNKECKYGDWCRGGGVTLFCFGGEWELAVPPCPQ
jgi:hypothetical protein